MTASNHQADQTESGNDQDATPQVDPALPKNVVRVDRRKRSDAPRPHSAPTTAQIEGGVAETTDLIKRLWKKAAEKGIGTRELSRILGISYPYLMHLANPKNGRSTDGPRGMDREVLRRAAEFLEVPLVQAFVLANILKPEDFFYKPSLAEKLEAAYVHMTQNGLWCGFAPSRAQWDGMTDDLKLSFVMLYEQTVNRSFLDRAQVPVPSED